MKRFISLVLLLSITISLPSFACSKGKVYLGKMGTNTVVNQLDFFSPNRTYVISGVCDLAGKSIKIPEKSVIDLSKGELRGGTIELSDGVTLRGGHTKNLNVSTIGYFANKKVFLDNQKYAISHFQSVNTNIELLCDINLATRSSGLLLNGNLDGNGHSLRIEGSSYDLLYLNKDNITIKDVTLENKTNDPKTDCRIILCRASNIRIERCVLRGAMVFAPRASLKVPIRNIMIVGNNIECDFSSLAQGYGYQHDVLTFRACKDISIVDNRIIAKDVNRVFKTARGWAVEEESSIKSKTLPCVENIVIKGNNIHSDASCGKQFWDMYNGTINPSFIDNTVKCFGHTVLFENKTKDDNGAESTALIEGNTIESDWKLFFINSNKGNDSYIIRNNKVIVSGSEREHTDKVGQKKNRNYINSMAGFSSLLFENNMVMGVESGEGLYPFIFQLEGGDVTIRNNNLKNLGPVLVVDSADLNSFVFYRNEFKSLGDFDCDISISGNVNMVKYENATSSQMIAVRMTKEAFEMSQRIEIDSPETKNQLVIKHGPSFERNHGKLFKLGGQVVFE